MYIETFVLLASSHNGSFVVLSSHKKVRILAITAMISVGRICRPVLNGSKQKGAFFENLCCGQVGTTSVSCCQLQKLVNHAHDL